MARPNANITQHEKTEQVPEHKEIEHGQSKFDVTKWHLKTPQGDELYQSIYGKTTGEGISKGDATISLFGQLGLPTTEGKELDAFLATISDCPEKQTLVNVLY